MKGEGRGRGSVFSHNDLSVWRRGDGLYKVRKCPSHTTRRASPLIKHLFNWSTCIHSQHLKAETMCAYACKFMSICASFIPNTPPPVHPPRTLIHAGGDVKEMGGIWWSVFICSISLFFSERNKSHVGDAA